MAMLWFTGCCACMRHSKKRNKKSPCEIWLWQFSCQIPEPFCTCIHTNIHVLVYTYIYFILFVLWYISQTSADRKNKSEENSLSVMKLTWNSSLRVCPQFPALLWTAAHFTFMFHSHLLPLSYYSDLLFWTCSLCLHFLPLPCILNGLFFYKFFYSQLKKYWVWLCKAQMREGAFWFPWAQGQ